VFIFNFYTKVLLAEVKGDKKIIIREREHQVRTLNKNNHKTQTRSKKKVVKTIFWLGWYCLTYLQTLQTQSPSGGCSIGGVRQNMWYPRSQLSQNNISSSLLLFLHGGKGWNWLVGEIYAILGIEYII